jgi:hypothetical protein
MWKLDVRPPNRLQLRDPFARPTATTPFEPAWGFPEYGTVRPSGPTDPHRRHTSNQPASSPHIQPAGIVVTSNQPVSLLPPPDPHRRHVQPSQHRSDPANPPRPRSTLLRRPSSCVLREKNDLRTKEPHLCHVLDRGPIGPFRCSLAIRSQKHLSRGPELRHVPFPPGGPTTSPFLLDPTACRPPRGAPACGWANRPNSGRASLPKGAQRSPRVTTQSNFRKWIPSFLQAPIEADRSRLEGMG